MEMLSRYAWLFFSRSFLDRHRSGPSGMSFSEPEPGDFTILDFTSINLVNTTPPLIAYLRSRIDRLQRSRKSTSGSV